MSAMGRNSYKYKQIKHCITIITKTNITRILLRGIIGEGLACVGWVYGGVAGRRGAVSAASSTGYYWVECAGLDDEKACDIYTAVLSLVYIDL